MIVCKFGGTSVGDAESIARTASIIKQRRDRQPIVVVSALGGATNQLLQIAEQAAKGQTNQSRNPSLVHALPPVMFLSEGARSREKPSPPGCCLREHDDPPQMGMSR